MSGRRRSSGRFHLRASVAADLIHEAGQFFVIPAQAGIQTRRSVDSGATLEREHAKLIRHCERSEAIQGRITTPWIASLRSQ
ncbi:hypothetical protein SPHINGO8AM_180038 [Sphingomonas sp. 8AM]|nr:hypothetical protein SPHINGO8AM_180038 [Sphingomonas sp. 8AM]